VGQEFSAHRPAGEFEFARLRYLSRHLINMRFVSITLQMRSAAWAKLVPRCARKSARSDPAIRAICITSG